MPSFISSFERPFRAILAAAVLALMLAAGWDLFWRHRGFAPMVVDDVNIWTIVRRHADSDPRVVALAGSSRFLMGLNLKVLQNHFPNRRFAQLSINGGSPLSVLMDLADDERFQGSVICEVLPHMVYTNMPWEEAWGGYQNLPWIQRFEAPMHVYLSEKTNLLLPDLALTNVLRELMKYHRLPKPGFLYFNADRQGQMDFSRIDPASLAAMREQVRAGYATVGVPVVGTAFERRIAEIRQAAEKIRRRGGNVLFFRMVSSSQVREVENERFPDPLYWDVFRQRIGFPCLNYAEVPGLSDFVCVEGAHLDRSDAPAFTAKLADALVSRNLLR